MYLRFCDLVISRYRYHTVELSLLSFRVIVLSRFHYHTVTFLLSIYRHPVRMRITELLKISDKYQIALLSCAQKKVNIIYFILDTVNLTVSSEINDGCLVE